MREEDVSTASLPNETTKYIRLRSDCGHCRRLLLIVGRKQKANGSLLCQSSTHPTTPTSCGLCGSIIASLLNDMMLLFSFLSHKIYDIADVCYKMLLLYGNGNMTLYSICCLCCVKIIINVHMS